MIFTNIQTVLCCDECGGAQTKSGRPFSVSLNRSYSSTDEISLDKILRDREKVKAALLDDWQWHGDTFLCPYCSAKALKKIKQRKSVFG